MEELSLPFSIDRFVAALQEGRKSCDAPAWGQMQHAIATLEAQYCDDGALGRVDVRPDRDVLLVYETGGRSREKIERQYDNYCLARAVRDACCAVPSYRHHCAIDMELRESGHFEKAAYYLGEFLRKDGLALLRDITSTNELRYSVKVGKDSDGADPDIRMRFVRHPQMANEIAMSVLLDDKLPGFTDIHRRVRMWRARLHNNYEGMAMNGTTEWNVRLLGGV